MQKTNRFTRVLVALLASLLLVAILLPIGYFVGTQPRFNAPSPPSTTVSWSGLPTPTAVFTQWQSYTHPDQINRLLLHDNLLWIATNGGLFAQDPLTGELSHFTVVHGLVGNQVTDLVIGSDNSLWISSPNGVGRYNGRSWESFTTEDGLPDGPVNAITRTADGAIWAGSRAGLARYDGRRWTAYNQLNTLFGLPSQNIRFLTAVPGSNTLWAGTDAGLAFYDGRQWEAITSETSGLISDNIQALAVSSSSVIWVGHDAGIQRFENGRWQQFVPADGLATANVQAITAVSDSEIWLSYGNPSDGISQLTLNSGTPSVITFSADNDFPLATLGDVASVNGRLLIGTSNGLYEQSAGQWTALPLPADLPTHDFTELIGARGTVWLSSNQGISRFDGTQFQQFTQADGLLSNEISTLAIGPGETPYAAYAVPGMGLSRLQSDGGWELLDCPTTAPQSMRIYAADQAPDGSTWFATDSGVARVLDGKWQIFTQFHGLPNGRLWDIDVNGRGTVLVGGQQGMGLYQNGVWARAPVGEISQVAINDNDVVWAIQEADILKVQNDALDLVTQLPSNPIGNLIATDDAVWLGTSDGIARLDAITDQWQLYGVGEGLPFNRTPTLSVDDEGSLWAISESGPTQPASGYYGPYNFNLRALSRLTPDNRWEGQLITDDDKPLHGIITDFATAPDGSLWASTLAGISQYDGEKWRSFTVADGLASYEINAVAYAFGGIWAAGPRGVIQLVPHATAAPDGPGAVTLNRLGWQVNGFLRVRLAVSPDGLWASNGESLHQFDGNGWQEIPLDPSLGSWQLDSMTFDDNGRLWVTASVQREGSNSNDRFYVGNWDGAEWTWDPIRSDEPTILIQTLTFGPDGRLWGSTGSTLLAFDVNRPDFGTAVSQQRLTDPITDFAFLPDGDLLLTSRFNPILTRLQTGAPMAISAPLPAATSGYAIHIDDQGTVWMGTDAGIGQLTTDGWRAFSAPAFQPEGQTISLNVKADGSAWLGSSNGQVIHYADGQVEQLPLFTDPRSVERPYPVTAVFANDEGDVMIGSIGGGVAQFPRSGNGWQRLGSASSLYDGLIQTVTFVDGTAWLGSSNGVFIRDTAADSICRAVPELLWEDTELAIGTADNQLWLIGDGLVYFAENDAFGRAGHQAIAAAAGGADETIWFVTESELVRHENGRLFRQRLDLPTQAAIYDIAISPEGAIWLASANGVFIQTGRSWERWDSQNGLSDNTVRHLQFSPDGTIWFVTDGGVSRYLPTP